MDTTSYQTKVDIYWELAIRNGFIKYDMNTNTNKTIFSYSHPVNYVLH